MIQDPAQLCGMLDIQCLSQSRPVLCFIDASLNVIQDSAQLHGNQLIQLPGIYFGEYLPTAILQ